MFWPVGLTGTCFRGAVVTQECVEKLIRKDMMDPVTGDKLSDRDIIPLQRVCNVHGLIL